MSASPATGRTLARARPARTFAQISAPTATTFNDHWPDRFHLLSFACAPPTLQGISAITPARENCLDGSGPISVMITPVAVSDFLPIPEFYGEPSKRRQRGRSDPGRLPAGLSAVREHHRDVRRSNATATSRSQRRASPTLPRAKRLRSPLPISRASPPIKRPLRRRGQHARSLRLQLPTSRPPRSANSFS